MNIPMVDLKGQYLTLKDEIDSAILEGLSATQFILGPNVQAFEKETSDYLGVEHAVGVASGTDALHLALAAAGIGEGDEVITTPFTFIATAEAIRYVGATPVFVDIQPDSLNIDPDRIREAITPKTRAIIPVHIFGQAAEMDEIMAIAGQHELQVIEDCAQSFGSHYHTRMTGSIGDVGAFSFFPSKNLGCYGDGGLVTTESDELAARLKMYRNHGSSQPYHHDVIGYNSRLDALQAAVLAVKLPHLEDWLERRRAIARRYREALADLPGLRLMVPSMLTGMVIEATATADDAGLLQAQVTLPHEGPFVVQPLDLPPGLSLRSALIIKARSERKTP